MRHFPIGHAEIGGYEEAVGRNRQSSLIGRQFVIILIFVFILSILLFVHRPPPPHPPNKTDEVKEGRFKQR